MINKTIKLLLLTLIFTHCSLKSNNVPITEKVTYSDLRNPHAKMQLPIQISWEHDKPGNSNDLINITITAKSMSNLTNSTILLNFSPDLKLISGDSSKTITNFNTGASETLNLRVKPEKPGTYAIGILLNASLNGEKIGTARTIEFSTADFVQQKQEQHPSGYHIIEGKTDNGK